MKMSLDEFYTRAWNEYITLCPSAQNINALLEKEKIEFSNDHIAYRSIAKKGWGIDALKKDFLNWGYLEKGSYYFEEKKVRAIHMEKKNAPKIFLSELCLELMAAPVQEVFNDILRSPVEEDFLLSKRSWEILEESYLKLKEYSEYASWVYLHGIRPNHFTIDVEKLNGFSSLVEFNEFLKRNGMILSKAGGEIKGSSEVLLEQSSTIADTHFLYLEKKEIEVPGCYYEFAYRHLDERGKRYEGFVTKNANYIFESTYQGNKK